MNLAFLWSIVGITKRKSVAHNNLWVTDCHLSTYRCEYDKNQRFRNKYKIFVRVAHTTLLEYWRMSPIVWQIQAVNKFREQMFTENEKKKNHKSIFCSISKPFLNSVMHSLSSRFGTSLTMITIRNQTNIMLLFWDFKWPLIERHLWLKCKVKSFNYELRKNILNHQSIQTDVPINPFAVIYYLPLGFGTLEEGIWHTVADIKPDLFDVFAETNATFGSTMY